MVLVLVHQVMGFISENLDCISAFSFILDLFWNLCSLAYVDQLASTTMINDGRNSFVSRQASPAA
jgi:ABC-type microcin C transport system permease subunit YejB